MQTIDIIAGIAWDPEIRGFLAVLTGVIVLMGSVWLMLATNSGARLAALISLAGFFGWMFIMGTVWWIYGIGWIGDAPSWELEEIVESTDNGDLELAALDETEQLQSEQLPSAYEIVIASDDEVANAEFGEVTIDTVSPDEIEGLDEAEIEEYIAEQQAINEATTLSELASVSPDLVPDDDPALGDWTIKSTAEAGEAQASAIAFLLEDDQFTFAAANEVKGLDAFDYGGKDKLPDDPDRLDRIWTQVKTALTPTHPTRYSVVQFQPVTAESLETVPGEPPPIPFADTEEPVISVVMVRNLGNLRQPPALVTIGSLLIFLALCYMLHERDKLAQERRAEFEAAK